MKRECSRARFADKFSTELCGLRRLYRPKVVSIELQFFRPRLRYVRRPMLVLVSLSPALVSPSVLRRNLREQRRQGTKPTISTCCPFRQERVSETDTGVRTDNLPRLQRFLKELIRCFLGFAKISGISMYILRSKIEAAMSSASFSDKFVSEICFDVSVIPCSKVDSGWLQEADKVSNYKPLLLNVRCYIA